VLEDETGLTIAAPAGDRLPPAHLRDRPALSCAQQS
jgi:hypothetical protein